VQAQRTRGVRATTEAMGMRRFVGIIIVLAGGVAAAPAAGQQRQADLHANYVRMTRSESNAWGAGAALQLTWGGTQAPINVGTSVGADYLKQEQGGPSQTSVTGDVTLQPGGGGSVTPYAGGSASANWSTGRGAQWSGARLGLEGIGGLQVKLSGALAVKAEERFGYVRGEEHALTTRVGVATNF
jgi:hypothetical protein